MEESLIAHLHIVNCLNLCFIEPFDALSILPQAELDFVVTRDDIRAQAMLLALVPVPLVAPLVGPRIDPKAVLLVVLVLSPVLPSVVPNVDAHPLHIIVQPLALVLAPIEPRIDTNAADFVLTPVTSIHRAIVPLIAPDPMLPAKGVIALIARLVRPGLHTVPMLQVVLPHALVLGPIDMFVDASPVGLVVGPVSIVDVAIDVNESTFTMSPIFTPLTGVFGSIVPSLLPEPVSEATFPLTSVHSARLESIRGSLLSLLVGIVYIASDCLSCLFLCEVLTAPHLFGSKH